MDKMEKIIRETKTAVIVGLSPKEEKTSHTISKKIKEHGYDIIPVYPKGDVILGEKVYRKVTDIDKKFETVIIFLSPKKALEVVKIITKLDFDNIWLQKGIVSEEAKKIAEENGKNFVMDRCFYAEMVKLKK